MESGRAFFVKRALLALVAYTALSALTYLLEGRLTHWFFNPALDNLLIGSFVLFAFTLLAGKRLKSLPRFPGHWLWMVALLALAVAVLVLRMGLEESLARKALSTLAGLLITVAFLGRGLSLHLAKNYAHHVIPGILSFYIIDYVFDWNFLGLPVLSFLTALLKTAGVKVFLDASTLPPVLNVFNVQIRAVEETAGVDALILYSIAFLGLAAWKGKGTNLRTLARPFAVGLAGAFALVLARFLALVILFGVADVGFVNALAVSPLNQALFLAYPWLFWKRVVEKGK